MDKHLIELALEALEAKKAALNTEIAALRAQLRLGRSRRTRSAAATTRPRRRRGMSAAARKAQSERMRAYWAKKRASSRKPKR